MSEPTPNEIKHRLRQQGYTLKSWAQANGFKYRTVSDAVRGLRQGNYGEGREVRQRLLDSLEPSADHGTDTSTYVSLAHQLIGLQTLLMRTQAAVVESQRRLLDIERRLRDLEAAA